MEISINHRILPFINTQKRVKILVGGRGSGKSVGIADIILMMCAKGKTILAAREFQTSIEDSVHSLLQSRIETYNLHGFTSTNRDITHPRTGGRIFYKGLARNVSSLKSLGSVDICWIEEGESIGDKSLQILTPSIRSLGDTPPEIWVSMNRHSTQGAIAKKYLDRAEKDLSISGSYEDELLLAVQLNYSENPWFPSELDLERLDDKQRLSDTNYNHIWNGAYYDELDNSIIKSDWFDSCIDAHIKLGFVGEGVRILSYDPSDEGGDDKAIVVRYGSVIERCEVLTEGDVAAGTDWAIKLANDTGSDVFTWDCDGMGVALKRQVASEFENYVMFKGSNKPEGLHDAYSIESDNTREENESPNAKTFKNKRAQYYWRLRDRMYYTHQAVVGQILPEDVDFDECLSLVGDGQIDIPKLRYEVCRIPLKSNPNGTIQIASKTDMSINSPNRADALMMSMMTPAPNTRFDINFDTIW